MNEKEKYNLLLDKYNELNKKIKEIEEYIEKTKNAEDSTTLPSGKKSDVGYCLDALKDIEEILQK